MCGSVGSQLMHVNLQKSTSTCGPAESTRADAWRHISAGLGAEAPTWFGVVGTADESLPPRS
jgi:hypothetical protein